MSVDVRDILAGLGMIAIGIGAAVISPAYGIGTARSMGAGFFPFALGLLSIVIGLAIAGPAFFRFGTAIKVEWRPLIAVLVAISGFALCASAFGYLPGVALATALAALGDRKNSPLDILGLVVCVTLGVWLIFTLGLHVTPQALKGF